MKGVFVLLVVALWSCSESKKEALVPIVIEGDKEQIDASETSVALLPTYNFDEFEALLKKETDSTYVINFWATWCKPCIKELPYFEEVNKTYADKKVKVILVSLDFPELVEKQVIPFIEKRNIASEVILLDDPDSNTWIPKVDRSWSGAIPATVLYNKEHRKFYESSFTLEGLETEIQSIL